MYYLYLLRCSNQSLYCGYTQDLGVRLRQHLGKTKGGAKFTRSFPPTSVEAVWQLYLDQSEVMLLEYRLKQRSKTWKEALLLQAERLFELLEQPQFCPTALEVISSNTLKAIWHEACYA